jgi:hypothetical protein
MRLVCPVLVTAWWHKRKKKLCGVERNEIKRESDERDANVTFTVHLQPASYSTSTSRPKFRYR